MCVAKHIIVKICGITCSEDANLSLEAGADWLGLNLVSGPRRIDATRARQILEQLEEPARAVALLALGASADAPATIKMLRELGVSRLQLYGNTPPDAIRELSRAGFELIVARPISNQASLSQLDDFLASCGQSPPHFVLLDGSSPGRLGGTGTPANWEAINAARNAGLCDKWPPILLAGGLTPDNVGEAIRAVRSAGIDVCSGVESQPGRKDGARIEAFVAAVRACSDRRSPS